MPKIKLPNNLSANQQAPEALSFSIQANTKTLKMLGKELFNYDQATYQKLLAASKPNNNREMLIKWRSVRRYASQQRQSVRYYQGKALSQEYSELYQKLVAAKEPYSDKPHERARWQAVQAYAAQRQRSQKSAQQRSVSYHQGKTLAQEHPELYQQLLTTKEPDNDRSEEQAKWRAVQTYAAQQHDQKSSQRRMVRYHQGRALAQKHPKLYQQLLSAKKPDGSQPKRQAQWQMAREYAAKQQYRQKSTQQQSARYHQGRMLAQEHSELYQQLLTACDPGGDQPEEQARWRAVQVYAKRQQYSQKNNKRLSISNRQGKTLAQEHPELYRQLLATKEPSSDRPEEQIKWRAVQAYAKKQQYSQRQSVSYSQGKMLFNQYPELYQYLLNSQRPRSDQTEELFKWRAVQVYAKKQKYNQKNIQQQLAKYHQGKVLAQESPELYQYLLTIKEPGNDQPEELAKWQIVQKYAAYQQHRQKYHQQQSARYHQGRMLAQKHPKLYQQLLVVQEPDSNQPEDQAKWRAVQVYAKKRQYSQKDVQQRLVKYRQGKILAQEQPELYQQLLNAQQPSSDQPEERAKWLAVQTYATQQQYDQKNKQQRLVRHHQGKILAQEQPELYQQLLNAQQPSSDQPEEQAKWRAVQIYAKNRQRSQKCSQQRSAGYHKGKALAQEQPELYQQLLNAQQPGSDQPEERAKWLAVQTYAAQRQRNQKSDQ